MKSKILKLSVFITILFAFCTIKSYASVTASSKTINSGESVTISVTSSKTLGAYRLELKEHNGLSFSSANSSSGQVNGKVISGASTTGVTTLGNYVFKAPEVTSDTVYNIKISATGMETPNLDNIPDSTVSVSVTVKAPESKKEPTFKNVNETMYARIETNVRSGYSTSTSLVGKLAKGTEINRIGIGDNGWSRVKYNGSTAYILTANLTQTKPEEKSSVNTLSSLIIEEGNIYPSFNSDITEYTLEVSGETDKLEIKAVPTDSAASVVITGNEELVIGENVIKITVKAANGATKTYNIKVNKLEKKPLQLINLSILGLTLTPNFSPDIYEYSLELPADSTVTDLGIETLSNTDNAVIEIIGNENFKEGENVVTILVSSPNGEEVISYQIIVKKLAVVENVQAINNKEDIIFYIILSLLILAIIITTIILIAKTKKQKDSKENKSFKTKDSDEFGYGKQIKSIYENEDEDEDENDIPEYKKDNRESIKDNYDLEKEEFLKQFKNNSDKYSTDSKNKNLENSRYKDSSGLSGGYRSSGGKKGKHF